MAERPSAAAIEVLCSSKLSGVIPPINEVFHCINYFLSISFTNFLLVRDNDEMLVNNSPSVSKAKIYSLESKQKKIQQSQQNESPEVPPGSRIFEDGHLKLSLEEIVEINDWRTKQGYRHLITPEEKYADTSAKTDLTSYESYETDTLKALADCGDSVASLILGRRLQKEKDYENAERYLREAATDGYASALEQLAWVSEKKAKSIARSRVTDEQSKRDYITAVVDSYAWNMVFNIRFAPERHCYDGSGGRWRERLGKETDDQLVVAARKRAKMLYAELEKARYVSGRAEFDNSAPEVLVRILQP